MKNNIINNAIDFNKFCMFSSLENILTQEKLRPFTLYTFCNYQRFKKDIITELKDKLALFLDIDELI